MEKSAYFFKVFLVLLDCRHSVLGFLRHPNLQLLEFLNRGQQWVARKISEALPHVEQDFVRDALFAMQESHLLNIEACDALVETPEV